MKEKYLSALMGFTMLFSLASAPLVLSSCAAGTGPSPATTQGAAAGAAVGSVAGLLIDNDNRWRGALIGGLLGGVLGGTVTEISQRASREAAAEGRPVVYQSNDGFQRVEASPVGYDEETRCNKVRERVWQEGRLVKDEVREVCESERTEPRYYYE
ncbi:MAG: glycine zipper 2TM domain-containing protein [Deltaproteobacteria bacterium]